MGLVKTAGPCGAATINSVSDASSRFGGPGGFVARGWAAPGSRAAPAAGPALLPLETPSAGT
eukprot:11219419-Lingulodinium_polyedra.AAC.1